MPFPTFRTFVGVAKDSINATLNSSVTAGGTTLGLQNTVGTGPLVSSGATYTAIIFDGAHTEEVACTGNLGGGSIAVAALTYNHAANCYVAFQLTASLGPTNYIPVQTFEPADEITQLMDDSMRGYAAKTYGVQPGNRKGSWNLNGVVFPDTFGYIAGGHFGADAVTGAGPYTHKFSANNAGTYQPAHYLLYALNGYNTRVYAGSICTELAVSFDSTKLVTYTSKWLTRASGVLPTPTQSFSGITPVPSWMAAIALAGSPVGKLITFDATFVREESAVVEALTGNQDPYYVFAGPQTCKGKFTAVKEDDSILNYYLGATPLTQPTLSVVLTNGSGGSQTGITVQLSQAAITNVVPKLQGKSFVEEDCDYEGIANSTDGTPGGGSAPAQLQLVNAVSSATTYV